MTDKPLGPEVRWLLDVCRAALLGPGMSDPVERVPGDVDWRELMTIALTSRTSALLAWQAIEGNVALPDWVNEVSRAMLLSNRSAEELLVAEAAELHAAAGDCRLLARKGLDVARRYPARGLRRFSDIDLLVHPDDTEQVVDALFRLGFVQGRDTRGGAPAQPFDRQTRLYFMFATTALPTFVKALPESSPIPFVIVDVATKFVLPRFGREPPADELWAARREGEPKEIASLSPLHLCIDLCANLYTTCTTLDYVWKRRYRRLTSYLDLLLLAHDGVPWDELVAMAEAYEMTRSTYFALGNLERLFPGTVPTPTLSELAEAAGGPVTLDTVGLAELDPPYVWDLGLHERMFSGAVPQGLALPDVLPGSVGEVETTLAAARHRAEPRAPEESG